MVGPLPFDLTSNPYGVPVLALRVDADVIMNSLKDAAVRLTDDRVGGMVNRASQACVVDALDVLALHHQRKGVKGQNGEKPKRLENVYGSTWRTSGMGSVVLL